LEPVSVRTATKEDLQNKKGEKKDTGMKQWFGAKEKKKEGVESRRPKVLRHKKGGGGSRESTC